MRGIAAAKLDEALERRWRGKVRRGLALQLSRRLDGQESFLLFKRGGLRVPLLQVPFLGRGSLPWMKSREMMRATANGCSWSVEGIEFGSSQRQ
jgi:hypothetical protein